LFVFLRRSTNDYFRQLAFTPLPETLSRPAAGQQLQEVVQALQARWPQAAKVLVEAEEDVLAYMAFPREHWTRIFSTNVLERLNREVKRRTEVVGVFPNTSSVIRLVGAVLLEIDDEWQIERRYFSQESMHKLTEPSANQMAVSSPLRLAPVR
jgi:transposase-like protein